MQGNVDTYNFFCLHMRSIPLFCGLTDEELIRLSLHLHTRTVLSGSVIVLAGQRSEAIYFLCKGNVSLQMDQFDGTTVLLSSLGSGDIIGLTSLAGKREYPATAVAREDTMLLSIDFIFLQECLGAMPVLAFNLINVLADELNQTYDRIQLLAAKDVYQRVAGHLVTLAEKYGERNNNGRVLIAQRLTQNELAHSVGASRVRVNQAIALLKQQCYLSIDRRFYITIHNLEALKHVI